MEKTQRGRPAAGGGRGYSQASTSQGSAMGCQEPSEAGKQSHSQGPRNQPHQTIWLEDFILQNCSRINFYCLKLQSLWKFFRAARKGIYWSIKFMKSIKFHLPILHYFLYGVHKPKRTGWQKKIFFSFCSPVTGTQIPSCLHSTGTITYSKDTDRHMKYFHSLNLRGSII